MLWSSVASVRSGAPDRATGGAQPVERLRAGDLVQQVQVDVEQVGLALGAAHDVRVPDLLRQRASHGDVLSALRPALVVALASRIVETAVSPHGQLYSGVGVLDKAALVLAALEAGPADPRRAGPGDRPRPPDRAPAGGRARVPPAGRPRPAGPVRPRPAAGRARRGRRRGPAARGRRSGPGLAARRRPARAPSSTAARATSGSASPPPSGCPGCATACRSAASCRCTPARPRRCCSPGRSRTGCTAACMGARFTATMLAGVRRRGWAQSVGEREPGVASVSAPVRGPSGRVVAAVSVVRADRAADPLPRPHARPGRHRRRASGSPRRCAGRATVCHARSHRSFGHAGLARRVR